MQAAMIKEDHIVLDRLALLDEKDILVFMYHVKESGCYKAYVHKKFLDAIRIRKEEERQKQMDDSQQATSSNNPSPNYPPPNNPPSDSTRSKESSGRNPPCK